MTMTDSELKCKCFSILAEQVGSVEMERFVMLLNRDTFDYTEWRKKLLSLLNSVPLAIIGTCEPHRKRRIFSKMEIGRSACILPHHNGIMCVER